MNNLSPPPLSPIFLSFSLPPITMHLLGTLPAGNAPADPVSFEMFSSVSLFVPLPKPPPLIRSNIQVGSSKKFNTKKPAEIDFQAPLLLSVPGSARRTLYSHVPPIQSEPHFHSLNQQGTNPSLVKRLRSENGKRGKAKGATPNPIHIKSTFKNLHSGNRKKSPSVSRRERLIDRRNNFWDSW